MLNSTLVILTRGVPPSEADTLLAYKSIFGRANISLFHLLARVTVNIHVILRKMAKPREKVRNAMLHNYDSARYLASKVTYSIYHGTLLLGVILTVNAKFPHQTNLRLA